MMPVEKFNGTMDEAISHIKQLSGVAEMEYTSGFYSCAVVSGFKVHATLRKSNVEIYREPWAADRDPDEPMHDMERIEIAKLAFLKLREDGLKDAALRLAYFLINSKSMTLGIGDIDWEIENALRYCGYDPVTVSGYRASVCFTGTIKVTDPIHRKLKAEFYD